MELSFKSIQLPLNYQFIVSNSRKTLAENIFITITREQITGYGEAAPSYFYHESPATVQDFLDQIRPLFNIDSLPIESIMDELEYKYKGNYAAKAAVNMALFDLMGKQLKVPIHQLLGIENNRTLVTSFTIGIDRLNVIAEKVIAAQNFPILKIKLGNDQDYHIIETIRKHTDCQLRIDANEGWTKEEAVEKINWLEKQNVEFVEQPLPAADLEAMKWVRDRVNLPLFADESLTTGQQMEQLIGAFDGINIKLMKCGGITEALKMVHQARQLKLKTMLGCFIESSLGITAAPQIAPLFDYIDLDGALLLKADPFTGVQISNGELKLPAGPGLGVELKVL